MHLRASVGPRSRRPVIIRAGILTVLVASSLSAAVASAPPAAALTVPVVAGNGNHDCAAMPTNRLFCWGDGRSGQLGNGKQVHSHIPVGVKKIPSATAVDGGAQDSCAIDNAGQVWCWGANDRGQLGDGTTTPSSVPVKVSQSFVAVEIAVGTVGFACALDNGGQVWCWGSNDHGQLGNGTTTDSHVPVELGSFARAPAQHVDAGARFVCAVGTGGRLLCWGANSHGQLGDGTFTDRHVPVQVSGLTSGVVEVSTGGQHVCVVLGGGALMCWGENGHGQLGIGSTIDQLTPQPVNEAGTVEHVSAGEFHTCVLAMVPNGSTVARCWGLGLHGVLGDGRLGGHVRTTPSLVLGLFGAPAGTPGGPVSIASGAQHTCVVLSSGQVECWGFGFDGQLGDGTLLDHGLPTLVIGLTSGPQGMGGASNSNCALTQSLGVKCWGDNSSGELGNGTTVPSTTPVDVIGLSGNIDGLLVGDYYACALPVAGTSVQCWGDGEFGVLGNGGDSDKHTPTDVIDFPPAGNKVAAIGRGNEAECAITTGDGAWCWGRNVEGALGDGTTQNRFVPEHIKGFTQSVFQTDLSYGHSCVALTGGSARCSGNNAAGELGIGDQVEHHTPVIPHLPPGSVIQITTGANDSCAVMTGGSAYCWGYNGNGELGDGTTKDRSTPVPVTGLSGGVVQLLEGFNSACALLTTGGVKCWGANGHGQLGDGTNKQSPVPVDVQGLSHGVVEIAMGPDGNTACALVVSPQQMECWGNNSKGQLGDGSKTDSNVPVVVQGL